MSLVSHSHISLLYRPFLQRCRFFQHERARIVNGGADAAESGGADGGAAAAEPADAGGRKKRRHRTAHGKIGFAALAQTIAAKWKTLPASDKTVFEQRAAVEKDRYKREMEVWNKAQKEKRLTEQREQLKAVERLVFFYFPRICNHCLNPSCVGSCPSGALYKRGEDGIVLIDQVILELESGKDIYNAVRDSAISRMRPVSMAAVTTAVGMLPLVPDPFFASQAM